MKKIIVLLLSLATLLSMVACGGINARKIEKLTKEEAEVIEIYTKAYEFFELEEIVEDIKDGGYIYGTSEGIKVIDKLSKSDAKAYSKVLAEVESTELPKEDAIKYAVLARFYEGVAWENYRAEEAADINFKILTDEEYEKYNKAREEKELYGAFLVCESDYAVKGGNEEMPRIYGMHSIVSSEKLEAALKGSSNSLNELLGDFNEIDASKIAEQLSSLIDTPIALSNEK